MEQTVIYLLMVQKILNLGQTTLELVPLCLGNNSKDFSRDNMKRNEFYGIFL